MCSTDAARIARICRAIEELAGAASGEAAGEDQAGRAGASTAGDQIADRLGAAGDQIADRLAAVWAMVAEADPELAKRLPGYLTAAE